MSVPFTRAQTNRLVAITAAILTSGLALSAPFFAAPQASANCSAGGQWDPITTKCWTVQDRNRMGSANGSQGCRPGDLGGCRAAKQNSRRPVSTLSSPAEPSVAPGRRPRG